MVDFLMNLCVDLQTSNGSVMVRGFFIAEVAGYFIGFTGGPLTMVNKSPKVWVVPLLNGLINDA